ncbi:hypothetical protein FRC18_006307 [Serendipita sp. 400]|nr:hypothetical protein FRC18_006307 [Serendipita sp. 400]
MGSNSASVFTPLAPPQEHERIQRPSPLEGVQEQKRIEVIAHFTKEEYQLPQVSENGSLMEEEKFWLTNDCILRFLRATKWEVPEAIQRLESTLRWRREYGLYTDLTAELVEPEATTGHLLILGWDAQLSPALYVFPGRQTTQETARQIQYHTFIFERALDLTPPGVETVSLLVNYADRSGQNTGALTSISKARQVIDIVQNHYPERLGKAYVINIPLFVRAFIKIALQFVDPMTRQKAVFNPKVIEEGFIGADVLMNAHGWGGDVNFEYDHAQYWPAMLKLAQERRIQQMERWRALGAKIGLEEWDLKGGPSATAADSAPVDGPATNPA